MSNFYRDNPDIANTIDALDLAEVAALFEEDFRFAKDHDFAPRDAADAIDNYKRALDVAGDITGNRIAPTAEETDKVGNVLNEDGSVTYAPGVQLALDLFFQAGLMGISIPYEYGGLNMPCVVMTAVNDLVSRADGCLQNLIGMQGIAETINMFGDEALKKQYLPPLVRGGWTGAMALTEPDAGSDLQSVKTTAHQDADGNWYVNGVKRFITNGCGNVLLVLARTEPDTTDGRGLSCLVVERCPQIRVRRLEHKLGINGSPTCEIVFTEAPAKLMGLRKRGLITYVMALMNGARLGIAAQGTGIAESAYRDAREYAASRCQFGQTIDSFPALREILADMSVDTQAARALTYYCAKCVDLENVLGRRFERQKGTPEAAATRARLKRYANLNKMITPMAKYFASETSMKNANGAVAVLGGSGFMKDYPAERHLRDSRITTIYEGTSQLQVVAAVAGVTTGTVAEVVADVLDGVELTDSLKARLAEIERLRGELDAAVAAVKANADGKSHHDLQARKLVDAGIAVVVAALFVRMAAKLASPGKEAALDHWLALRFPEARCALAKATSGYHGSVTAFEALAPAAAAED